MSEAETNPSFDDTIHVVAWNILLDYKRTRAGLIAPQVSRLSSHIETLGRLDMPLDVVCLQEVQQTKKANHGELIAGALGHEPGFWFNHNTSKRPGEYIGMFGSSVESAESFETPHDKLGVVTRVGRTAIVGLHNRNEKWGPMRADQTEAVIDYLEGEEHAIVVGDANASPFERSRRMLHKAGFQSVFKLAGFRNPVTHPTPEYRDIFYPLPVKLAVPRGTSSDIIYVRGCEVVGKPIVFKGDSDHYGLAAAVRAV